MILNTGSFLGLVCFTSLTLAYPEGMPSSACDDMMPRHGVLPQASESPFVLNITEGAIKYGYYKIHFKLASKTNTPFKGFAIRAEYFHNVMPFGIKENSGVIKPACLENFPGGVGIAAFTHVNSNPKMEVNGVLHALMSLPVSIMMGDMFLKAVVVQDFETFWKDIKVKVPVEKSKKSKATGGANPLMTISVPLLLMSMFGSILLTL